MNDTEKLQRIKEYVEQMAPIYRIALLYDPVTTARHEGFDSAMWEVQQDLLKILNGE